MDEATRTLVRASAVLAHGEHGLAEALREAHQSAGVTAVEEMLLQSYLFIGYPRALRAMALWREVSGVRAPSSARGDSHEWAGRGQRVCGTVYGGQYERLRENVARLHPDLEQWMVEEGYGKVLGRAGLPLVTRELCIVALLAVQDAPAQLYSHLRGALNAGATEGDIEQTLRSALEQVSAGQAEEALEVWKRVRERSAKRPA